MSICDAFVKKLISLKHYSILHQDASQIIVSTKLVFSVRRQINTTFSSHEEIKDKTFDVFFMITSSDKTDKVKLFKKHNYPLLTISEKAQAMSKATLEKHLQGFTNRMFIQN